MAPKPRASEPKDNAVHCLPPVLFSIAERSWFVYGGVPYSVLDAPSDVFKAAIQSSHKRRLTDETKQLLAIEDLDITAKWWLLMQCQEVTLYGSKEQAQQAMSD